MRKSSSLTSGPPFDSVFKRSASAGRQRRFREEMVKRMENTQKTGHIDVAYVARLARLRLSREEIEMFGQQLDRVLEYFDQIRRVDVKGVEPTSHPMPLRNVFREDAPSPSGMAIGAERDGEDPSRFRNGVFVVPRIIE